MRCFLNCLSALALLLLTACPQTPPAQPPQVQAVGVEPVEPLDNAQVSRSAPAYIATVRANNETDFSFKVGGILELIGPAPRKDWDEGAPVRAGTVLARLQPGDFKNALASAKAAADFARSNGDRLRKLLASNVISTQEVDKGEADAETAEAQLRQAEQNLADSELRAPWDGVVLSRFANAGETVAAGKPVLRFGDTNVMSVELGVPDRLVGLFEVGKEISVDISALPGRPPFRGKISEVGVAANNAGRLYRVVIKTPNPDGLIRSGMTATVQAGGAVSPGAGEVLAPLSALIAPSSPTPQPGKAPTQLAVFVVQGGKAIERLVQTGDIVSSSIIVTEGLKAGEQVVTRGASQLYDGAPVAVR